MIKILIAGDYVPQNRVLNVIEAQQYEKVFGEVKDVLETIDYSVVNLECPLVLSDAKPIRKTGPNLKCTTTKMLDSIKWAGFDGVTLANNHFRDYGDVGVNTTLTKCDEIELDTVGGGTNINEASRVLIKQIKGQSVGIINICEKEYSIASALRGGANPIDTIKNYYQIKEAKDKCDYVIVIVHGGIEHYPLPTLRMQELYRFFVNAGADAVINHHQHCFSGYEYYEGKPIFYGLGNLCFDRPNMSPLWNMGYMVELQMDNNVIHTVLHPYYQGKDNPGVVLLKEEKDTFNSELERLNDIISDEKELRRELEKLLESKDFNVMQSLEPIRNRYVRAMQKRKLFPRLIKGKSLLLHYVYMNCESHREVLLHALEKSMGEIE